MNLADLKPGNIFEYKSVQAHYRQGVFYVLDEGSKYVNAWATENTVLIVNLETGMVCRHSGNTQVILLSESGEDKMSNRTKDEKGMNHFIDWKFGVPVKVFGPISLTWGLEALLVHEDELTFTLFHAGSSGDTYAKSHYHYELIPYGDRKSPRFPVCQNSMEVVFCNCFDRMVKFASISISQLPRTPDHTGTLTIDNKEIELSQETIAKLIKELGV